MNKPMQVQKATIYKVGFVRGEEERKGKNSTSQGKAACWSKEGGTFRSMAFILKWHFIVGGFPTVQLVKTAIVLSMNDT